MIKNYIKIALRNLWKKKTHSFINIMGLALGIASCLLVFIYVLNEVTYDRFHEKLAKLYRINIRSLENNGDWEEWGITSPIMAVEYARQVPEITATARLNRSSALTRLNGNLQNERFTFADPSLFDLFTFPVVDGDLKTFKEDPNSIILTEESAKRLFGDQRAVDQTLEMEFKGRYETFTVKGVLRNIPFNSSIMFGMVLPYSKYQQIANPQRFTTWLDQHIVSFVLLENDVHQADLEQKLTEILRSNVPDDDKTKFAVSFQPLRDIHLNGSVRGGNGVEQSTSFATSWILIGIGAFLLLIASINFINLSIGMALPRTKEIGLRKVAGARRPQIIFQFLGEAFLTCLFALTLAAAFVDLFLPVFERLTNRSLQLWQLDNLSLLIVFGAALILTALLAGSYPALVVSRFSPVESLKGEQKVGGRTYLTKGLIAVQFVLGIVFFLGSVTIQKQLQYIEDFDLGYDDKGLIGIDVWGESGDALIGKFKNELASYPMIQSVSGNSGNRSRTILNYLGKEYPVTHDRVDYDFFNTYKVKLLKGRNFDVDRPTDQTEAIIVNESFVKLLDLKDPVGMKVPFTYSESMTNPVIIGIMEDFHFESLKQGVDAMVFYVDAEIDLGQFLVRVDPMQTSSALEALRDAWAKLVPNRPFQYNFIEEDNQRLYAAEQKQKDIISYASGFALFISCLGLFGLTSLTITQRTKEIGIRKILGATVRQITWMVSSEFIAIVLVANLIAWPLAYYFMDQWLNGFAYRISVSWTSFLVSGLAALLIAAFTVSFQSIKSALANPVESLRNE